MCASLSEITCWLALEGPTGGTAWPTVTSPCGTVRASVPRAVPSLTENCFVAFGQRTLASVVSSGV